MILAVDIGNTRIKWQMGTAAGALALDELGELVQIDRPAEVRAACVASSEYQQCFIDLCAEHWSLTPRFAEVKQGWKGLRVAYREVSSLGVDRWLAMLAAVQAFPHSDLIVVDAGSAITVDVLRAGGEHCGGYIVPGWERLLSIGFARVDTAGVKFELDLQPGISTAGCLSSGCSALYVGFFRELLAELQHGFDQPKILLCGGAAPKFLPIMKPFGALWEPDLVFDGLTQAFSE